MLNINSSGNFLQRSQISTSALEVKSPDGTTYSLAGNPFATTSPNAFYDSYLKGKTQVGTKTSQQEFTVVGVHDGYGTATA